MNSEGYMTGVVIGVATILGTAIVAYATVVRRRVIEEGAAQAGTAVQRELEVRNIPSALALEANKAVRAEVRIALDKALP